MSRKSLEESKIILEKIKAHYGDRTWDQVAARLGIPTGTLGSWRSKGGLDEDVVYGKCKGINLEFLKTMKGELFPPPAPPTASPSPSASLGDGVLDRALWSEATLDSQALFGDILEENVQKCYDRLLVKQGRSPESPPPAKTEAPLKQAA